MQEEPSVSEILSSIKQALSKDIEGLSLSDLENMQIIDTPVVSAPKKSYARPQEVVIELTNQMRITNESITPPEKMVQQVSAPIAPQVDKSTPMQMIPPLKPSIDVHISAQLQAWLNKNLPDIVERAIEKEMSKIVKK